ncbi:hypothetical protein Y1Q_0005957 [Alligator mississippiensis]|uniref:Ig-like domain-containing protein n=1 Tax=Alligator mississippiensis TaxID=8496 RepID=A0A151MYW6_ALLMI|nr:hypothetical protein Y1Q_0005957 [Alligator mississippiensis]
MPLTESLRAPTVYPIFSCCGPEDKDNQAGKALACLVTGYLPEPVDVKWNSGKVTQGITTFPAVLGKDGDFTLTSQLTIPASSLESGVYQCDVEHRASTTFLSKAFPQQTCRGGLPAPPQVHLLPPSCNDNSWEKQLGLVCLLLDFIPGQANVEWLMNGVKKNLPGMGFSSAKGTGGLHMGQSRVNITRESWDNGDVYTCKVTHPALDKEDLMLNVSKCSEISLHWEHKGVKVFPSQYTNGSIIRTGQTFSTHSLLRVPQLEGERATVSDYSCVVQHVALDDTLKVNALTGEGPCKPLQVEVFLRPPSLEDLYLAKNATITCLVINMETTSSLEITWNRTSGGRLDVVLTKPVFQRNGSYSVSSALWVHLEEWKSGEEFTCMVKHQDIPSAIVKTVHKSQEVSTRAPSVYIYPPHVDELALRESATVTCLAKGFRPSDILVTWTQQDQPMPQKAFINIGPFQETKEKGTTYFIYSKLSVPASQWQRGDTFACVVGHEGFPMTFVHRSVDKSSGKPTAVNVSVILSDTDVSCY